MPRIFDEVSFDHQGQNYLLKRIQLEPKKSQGIRVYSHQGALVKQRGQTKAFLREINDSKHLGVYIKKGNGATKTVNELGTEIIRVLKNGQLFYFITIVYAVIMLVNMIDIKVAY